MTDWIDLLNVSKWNTLDKGTLTLLICPLSYVNKEGIVRSKWHGL